MPTAEYTQKEDRVLNFLASFVPAIIALVMVGAAVFMAIIGSAVPDFFVNMVWMILSYYFGIGIGSRS
jgi:formate/nitrite transporter FocA (FNT family)